MAITAAALALEIGVTQARAEQLLLVAKALCKQYAPFAPAPVKDESVIRCAGYLAGQPHAAIRSESIGDVRTAFAVTHISALRHSGAMSLLSPWKIRRGGAV